MFAKKLWIALCVIAAPLLAQTPPAAPVPQVKATTATATPTAQGGPEGGVPVYIRPETPQQRNARLGTQEDPGLDPDPAKHYWRFGRSFHIERFERKWAAYDAEEGYVRPMAMVNFAKEIYQQNDRYVWVWVLDPQPQPDLPSQPTPVILYDKITLDFFKKIRPDFTALTPPAKNVTVRFEDASEGLPQSGSWRNSLAVADMNGDGCPDLIAPPERGGNGIPAIFLGDCKGHWTFWKETKWPHPLDYGSVAAGDFNKDGHMDLAFAVHLKGVFAFLGDGKGNFTEFSEGLSNNYPTRRLAMSDVDGDGYPDLVAISEGPTAVFGTTAPGGNLRIFLNRKKGTSWQEVPVVDPAVRFGADWLAVGDFNGDRRPDFMASSSYQNSQEILFLSKGPKKWDMFKSDGLVIPSLSMYHANAAGKFTSSKHEDVVISYVHYYPSDLGSYGISDPDLKSVVNIDLLTFNSDQPKRKPIMRWGSNVGVQGMASGDFNGDGNLDAAFTRFDPREVVLLLGDGKGSFTRGTIEGIDLQKNTNYDLKAADVNGDGRPDLIIMYESSATTRLGSQDGSIHVYLNRGPVATPVTASK